MSKIVLVTLVHNRQHLVGQAIQSAINQTLDKSKWLHLIIDNASTDSAAQVCESFVKKYNHIHFVKMPTNLGQQKAYNYVLNEWIPKNSPDTKIFSVLDSDDLLVNCALEEVEKMFDAHPEVGQTYSGFSIIDGKGNIKVKDHPKAKLIPNQFTKEGQALLRKMFVSQNIVGHQRSFSVKCLLDIGGFNTQYEYATDYNISGRVLEKGWPIIKINKVLYLWRQHDDQVERNKDTQPKQHQAWLDMQKEFKERWTKLKLI